MSNNQTTAPRRSAPKQVDLPVASAAPVSASPAGQNPAASPSAAPFGQLLVGLQTNNPTTPYTNEVGKSTDVPSATQRGNEISDASKLFFSGVTGTTSDLPNLAADQGIVASYNAQARDASFGIINSGQANGKSQEQLQQEIFNQMLNDYASQQKDLINQQQADAQTKADKIASIRAAREKQIAGATQTSNTLYTKGQSRGFLA